MTLQEILLSEDPVEPETLYDLGLAKTSLEAQRILALRTIIHTEAVFEDFNVFENVVELLNGIEPNVEMIDGTDPEQIWYALKAIQELRPEAILSEEVQAYIRFFFKEAGITFLPDMLGMRIPDWKKQAYTEAKQLYETAESLSGITPEEIQAIHYGRILEYLNGKR
jgi:hypothetical protein